MNDYVRYFYFKTMEIVLIYSKVILSGVMHLKYCSEVIFIIFYLPDCHLQGRNFGGGTVIWGPWLEGYIFGITIFKVPTFYFCGEGAIFFFLLSHWSFKK